MENQSPQKKKKKGINWGFLVFLLIVFGPQLYAWASRSLSQLSSGSFNLGSSVNILPIIVIGVVVLIVIMSVVRAIGEATRSSPGQSWPTTSTTRSTPISSSTPERSTSISDLLAAQEKTQSASRLSAYASTRWDEQLANLFDDESEPFHFAEQNRPRTIENISDIPGAPRFEPVISGAAIAFGLLGALLLGGAFFLGNWLTTVLP